MRLPLLAPALALLTGCAGFAPGSTPAPLMYPADSAEYAALAARGEGTLELRGQAFATTRAGRVKRAAGRLVTLDPATSYAKAWFRMSGAELERFEVPAPDPRFAAARRSTTADAEGRFRFTRLAPGSYLLRSLVGWEGEEADSGPHGGVVAALVTLRDPAEEMVLSRIYTPESAALLGVAVLGDAELSARPYRSLGKVTGVSCETGWEEPARQDLLLAAGRKGADAVTRVACVKRGFSLEHGCWSRMECEGQAIGWR